MTRRETMEGTEMGESEIRRMIWTRKEAVDAKIAEEGFLDLAPAEQDAWVIALQLGIEFDLARRCVDGSATMEESAMVRAKVAEAFQYGKRKALRSLRTAVAVYPSLRS